MAITRDCVRLSCEMDDRLRETRNARKAAAGVTVTRANQMCDSIEGCGCDQDSQKLSVVGTAGGGLNGGKL